jgi:hypothetical protein
MAARAALLDHSITLIGAVNTLTMDATTAKHASLTAARGTGGGRGIGSRSPLLVLLVIVLLALTRRVRGVSNPVARAELRPRHLGATTTVKPSSANQAHARGLRVG